MRYNPFRPGNIAIPSIFGGRLAELALIERALFQTTRGNPTHFLIQGQRGIGKSSLLHYAGGLASGKQREGNSLGSPSSLLVLQISLEPDDDYLKLLLRLSRALHHQVETNKPLLQAAGEVWDIIKRFEIMGIKYNSPHERAQLSSDVCCEDLVLGLSRTMKQLRNVFQGAAILIDEADRGAAGTNLGHFIKQLTEGLMTESCTRVLLGVAAISGVSDELRRSHPSAARILQFLTLAPFSFEETAEAVEKALQEASAESDEVIRIDPGALRYLHAICGGYPHILQEVAFFAFDQCVGGPILERHISNSLLMKDGALEQLGRKYFGHLFFEDIPTEQDRRVLRAIAQRDGASVLAQIREETCLDSSTIQKSLAALRERDLVSLDGDLAISSLALGYWIRHFAHDEGEL